MSTAFLPTTLIAVAAFACTLGVVSHMFAAITGLAALLPGSGRAPRVDL